MNFSVLMPVYYGDKAEFIKEALESIVNQSLLPSEIVIIVDGAIGAETQEVLSDYQKNSSTIKIHYLEENIGLGDVLNFGLEKCKHEYIARMDADDICRKDRFEKQVKYLIDHPEIDLVGSYIHEFSTDPQLERIVREVPVQHDQIVKYSMRRNPFNHMTVMFKKSAVLDSGNYQKFIGFEDYFLWVRMIMRGKKFHNIPEALVFARTGQDMYKRRGGLQYFRNEVKLQWYFYKTDYITLFQYLSNVFVRSLVRIVPNSVRSKIYLNFLRN
ncbi:glycosyltransferase [Cytobacillus firmus]|uniref:glycosyltransferase n=1 Tax=Cytobacillus firmus TaxID=1399 RepID=UPI0021C75B24|nr:glycosyltransferase [Cytobacillus firmus]MCU1807084.1 glycosyltransferase [Cytobacillus firmus]